MWSQEPDNQEAHEILTKIGFTFLGSDGESGYEHPLLIENTLIVTPSGNWRLIEPTSYSEYMRAEGSIDDMKEELEEILAECAEG